MYTEKTPFKKLVPSQIHRGDIVRIKNIFSVGSTKEYFYSVVLRVLTNSHHSCRYFSYFTRSIEVLHQRMPCAIPFPFLIDKKSGSFIEETGVFSNNYRIVDVQKKAGYEIVKRYTELREVASACSGIPIRSSEEKIAEVIRGMKRQYIPEEKTPIICEVSDINVIPLETSAALKRFTEKVRSSFSFLGITLNEEDLKLFTSMLNMHLHMHGENSKKSTRPVVLLKILEKV